jgi:hypothetical protein
MSLDKIGIEQLIDRYKRTYIDNPSVMISGFTQENQIVADYNGRQILELMQNADDAGSDIIHIEIDTEKQILCISNKGSVFDLGGIESLMFPGISTKNKTEYIGNKGLGFRSILNWVDSVKILTGEVSISFSRSYTESFFQQYLADVPTIKARIAQEKQINKIDGDTAPIATLAFPELKDESAHSDYVTQIILTYKKNEERVILEQLETISEETLMFLRHSKRIVLVKNGVEELDLNKSIESDGSIQINSKSWRVVSKENLVYNDKVRFNYTIAWQDDLSDKGMFYTYFPTDVQTDLPCLIHATFDLTSNRKELNKCAENEFILNHIVESLSEIAEEHLKSTISDWKVYRFLTPQNLNNREFFKSFYSKVLEKRELIQCYPTISNQYIHKDEAIFYGNDLSLWVNQNQMGEEFFCLIKEIDADLHIKPIEFNVYQDIEWLDISRQISSKITHHHDRAVLIKHLVLGCRLNLDDNLKLPLLIGKDYEFNSGTYDEHVFAYNMLDENFILPEFANITFIASELYNELITVFEHEISIKKEGAEDKSRTLIRVLKPVVTLRQNDSNEVIRFIISELNKQGRTVDNVKKLTTFLFGIFKEKSDFDKSKKLSFDVPLVNRSNEIQDSSKLVFGDDYIEANHTEFIFDGIYGPNKYLGSKEMCGLDEAEDLDVVGFFSWLGVQNHFTTVKIKESSPYTDGYFNFLFRDKNVNKPENARISNIALEAFIIENIADIQQIEFNKLCVLLEKSNFLKRTIHYGEDSNFNALEYKFGNNHPKSITVNYTYVYYQISQLIDFNEYTISEDREYDVLFTNIDLGHEVISSHLNNIEIESLKLTLRQLGVSGSLEDVTEDRLKAVLEKQEDKFPAGKNSQNFYRKCLEYYLDKRKKNDGHCKIDYCDFFYGRKGMTNDELRLIEKENLYYSDNYLLPRKILNQFDFINLPKRIGEDNVKDIFGVKLIKDELNAIDILKYDSHHLSEGFSSYINALKPYILAYRIEAMKDKTSKQNEANFIKRLHIELVSELSLCFNREEITLDQNEFIPIKDKIYITSAYKNNVNELLQISEFCDAIAEIFCITFKVTSLKNTFRRVIKDGLKETSHILRIDEKEYVLNEAKELLGVNPLELEFWRRLYPDENLENTDKEEFIIQLCQIIHTDLPEYYKLIDFGNLATKQGVKFLEWVVKITGKALNEVIENKILKQWHREKTEDAIRDCLKNFREALWKSSNDGDIEQKRKFHQNYLEFADAANGEFFSDFYKKNEFILSPNYKEALNDFSKNKFEINLEETWIEGVNIENKYRETIRAFEIGIDIEDDEKILKEFNSEIYSLIFFEGFTEEIKKGLEILKKKENDILDDVSLNSLSDTETKLVITKSNISSAMPKPDKNHKKNNDFAHTSLISKKKALAGKNEEQKVVKALLSEGYMVNHVSKLTDSKHYDLEYKKPDGDWRYLEVKKDSGGYFFMSRAEKNTAINDANANKYDLAIVSGNNIHIIESPFSFEDESFEKNSNFFAEPVEYLIHFKINEK